MSNRFYILYCQLIVLLKCVNNTDLHCYDRTINCNNMKVQKIKIPLF